MRGKLRRAQGRIDTESGGVRIARQECTVGLVRPYLRIREAFGNGMLPQNHSLQQGMDTAQEPPSAHITRPANAPSNHIAAPIDRFSLIVDSCIRWHCAARIKIFR